MQSKQRGCYLARGGRAPSSPPTILPLQAPSTNPSSSFLYTDCWHALQASVLVRTARLRATRIRCTLHPIHPILPNLPAFILNVLSLTVSGISIHQPLPGACFIHPG